MSDETEAPRVRNGDDEREERRAMRFARKVVTFITDQKLERALTLPLTPSVERSLREWHATPRRKGKRAVGRIEDRLVREVRLANLVELVGIMREGMQAFKTGAAVAAEGWAARLVTDGDSALQELLEEVPAVDRQQLRRLIRVAQKEEERGAAWAALTARLTAVLS
jgi:ribosome-associated protein